MWPFRSRKEAFTVTLHTALLKDSLHRELSDYEVFVLDTYFPEGWTFMSEEEYIKRVAAGNFKDIEGGIVSVTGFRVNIHTRLGVRQT